MTTGSDPGRTAIVRALGFAPVWFLVAMALPATSAFALPLLVVVTVLAAWRGELDLDSGFDPIEFGLFVFAGAWIVCSLFGLDPGRSLRLSIPMLAALTAFFVLRRQRRADDALAAFDTALFALGAWQCLQLLPPLMAGLTGEDATQGSDALWLVEPNDIAWIAATWPAMLDRDWNARGRTLVRAAIALGLILMIVLGSRLALIVSVIALAPMLVRGGRRAFAAVLGLSGGLALAALWFAPAIFAKGAASLASREQLWYAAWNVFLRAPATGTGPHNFALAYQQYLPESLAVDPRITPWPHSLPLEIAASTGLTGMFATILLICAAFHYHHTAPTLDARRRRVLQVQCLVFLVLGLFEASFLRIWVWMLVASILCRLPLRAVASTAVVSTKGVIS